MKTLCSCPAACPTGVLFAFTLAASHQQAQTLERLLEGIATKKLITDQNLAIESQTGVRQGYTTWRWQ